MKKFTKYNDKDVCYHIEGKGKTVVLIHGFLENMDIWRDFSKSLSANHQVLLIDLPGHGNSEMQSSESHSMELMADIVNDTLEKLGIDKCVMIGHSMGGYVTLAFADNYQEKLLGFGVFHSHAFADTPEAKINRGRAIQVVKDNHKDFISAFIPDLFTKDNQKKLAKEISELQTASRKMSKEAVITALEGMRHRTDKEKLLRTTNLPVLFIIGKQDPRTPLEKMLSQIALPKHTEVLILDDVAHMGYLEDFNNTLSFVNHFVGIC
jgi:pimeloyl-ACP methyl ester carboxylesterase